MSYRLEQNGDIVIDGFEEGIADSPFTGLTDVRNMNLISVPGEASVNFATQIISPSVQVSATVTNRSSNTLTFTGGTGLKNGVAIQFTNIGSLTGVSTTATYWTANCAGTPTSTCELTTDLAQGTIATLGGTAGTAAFVTVNMAQPKYSTTDGLGHFFMVDSLGQVWTDLIVTPGDSYWTYMGNRVPGTGYTSGNGIAFYQSSTGVGYLFVFHNSSIDYTMLGLANVSWNYQWQPSTGASTGYSATPSGILHTTVGQTYTHDSIVAQDRVLYYCDSNWIGSIFEKPVQVFDPTNTATYTWSGSGTTYKDASGNSVSYALQLPYTELALCLAELGTNLLVGGQFNAVYPWDRISTSFTYPILIAENTINKMVTINTNTFLFAGNRGRIYITNGSQAQLYKKIPDHLSNTVEPYFTWGGATYSKNQLYFSVKATTNSGSVISTYGGVWALDVDTKSLRLANQLSYGTYGGYATTIITRVPSLKWSISNPAGAGLFIGWDSGASTYGIDQTVSTPYTGGQSYLVSDMIPIGTNLKKTTKSQIEFKLTAPLQVGESIQLLTSSSLAVNTNPTFVSLGTVSGDGSLLSGNLPVAEQGQQWLMVKVVSTGTTGTSSYNRLRELRVI